MRLLLAVRCVSIQRGSYLNALTNRTEVVIALVRNHIMTSKTIVKLNLGCHKTIKPGYTNVDKDHYPGVDMVSDCFDLNLPENYADEIYASNILEHAPHRETVNVLKHWHSILKEGGVLKLSVPDFEVIVKAYNEMGLCDWVRNQIWGDQIYNTAFHYTAFTEKTLTDALKQAGFSDISRVERLPGSTMDECSNNRIIGQNTLSGTFTSLNMVVVK